MEQTYYVHNQTRGTVIVTTQTDKHILTPMRGQEKHSIQLTLAEILFVNGRTNHFKNGTLTFDEGCKADLYGKCRIQSWEKILTPERVREVLRSGSSSEVQALISEKSMSVFSRVRNELLWMRSNGELIPGQIEACVNARFAELSAGKKETKIVPHFRRPETQNDSEAGLREQIAKLQRQLEEAQKKAGENGENADKTVAGKKPFPCPHCEASYAAASSLKSHITKKHPGIK